MSNTAEDNKKKATGTNRLLSESFVYQINVLRSLAPITGPAKPLSLQEISDRSSIKDEKETQRYLFILEGQKRVTPIPEGDFTSRNWQITAVGINAVKEIKKLSI